MSLIQSLLGKNVKSKVPVTSEVRIECAETHSQDDHVCDQECAVQVVSHGASFCPSMSLNFNELSSAPLCIHTCMSYQN